MAIRPDRLDRITTHADEPDQLKRRRRQFLFRVFIEVAQDVRLAFAPGAWAGAAQLFQRDKTLRAVRPLDRQLVPDLLDVVRLHGDNLFSQPAQVHTYIRRRRGDEAHFKSWS